MRHPDEGTVHAWLDGALPPDEAAEVERLVREDPAWAAAAAEARGLIANASRVLGALDDAPGMQERGAGARAGAGDVVRDAVRDAVTPLRAARPVAARAATWSGWRSGALAATVCLAALSAWVWRETQGGADANAVLVTESGAPAATDSPATDSPATDSPAPQVLAEAGAGRTAPAPTGATSTREAVRAAAPVQALAAAAPAAKASVAADVAGGGAVGVATGAASRAAGPAPAPALARAAREGERRSEGSAPPEEHPGLQGCIAASGYPGTVVLLDAATGRMVTNAAAGVDRARIPASTFKIVSAMFALEAGVVAGAETVIPWDSIVRDRPEVNRDLTLREAFRVSAVPHFQAMVRRAGPARVKALLDALGYGNRDTTGGAEQFWLTGGLRITPRQQLQLLQRLHDGTLPVSARTMGIVRDIMEVERTPERVVRAKTGWATPPGEPSAGWWVGWVERPGGGVTYFAAVLEARDPGATFGPARLEVVRCGAQIVDGRW